MRRLNVALTRAKHALVMLGCARTLGSGEAGEAASDLVRAAASASALWSYTGQGSAGRGGVETIVEAAPQLCADLLAAAGAGAAKRRRAASEGAATRDAEEHRSEERLGGRCKLARPRAGVRAQVRALASWSSHTSPHTSPHLRTSPQVQPREVDAAADHDADGGYLALAILYPHISLHLPKLPYISPDQAHTLRSVPPRSRSTLALTLTLTP